MKLGKSVGSSEDWGAFTKRYRGEMALRQKEAVLDHSWPSAVQTSRLALQQSPPVRLWRPQYTLSASLGRSRVLDT